MLRYLDDSVVIDGTDPSSPLFPSISVAIQSLNPHERGIHDIVRLECLIQPVRSGDTSRIAMLEGHFSGLVDLPRSCETVRRDRVPDILLLAYDPYRQTASRRGHEGIPRLQVARRTENDE